MDTALHYDPLDFYKDELMPSHKQNVEEYFNALTMQSGINVEENRKTVSEHEAKLKSIDGLKTGLFWLKFLRIALFIIAALSVILSISAISPFIGVPLAAASLLLVFLWLNKKIKGYDERLAKENKAAAALYEQALSQMKPLNELFSEDATLSLFEKTHPSFRFEKSFSEDMSQNLRTNYDMPKYDDENVSVLDTLSGHYNNNPFVYLRRLVHTLGMETYHGYRTISWRESYRDSKGNYRTRVRTQTLHASVTMPKPFYKVDTVLHFGAVGAPDLSFSREGKNINLKSDASIDKIVKRGEKKIAKKSRKAVSRGESFMSMTNSEFDVLFNAINRDHEVQFRVMFTPLAQTNMVELILSDDTYGDDFDFYKHKRNNIIRTQHAQSWSMETSPERYRSYSYDEAKNNFESFNNEYFKSVYFDFAPLLAIPVYHDDVRTFKTNTDERVQSYATEEYEAMANAVGARHFAHDETGTNIILKARYLSKDGDEEKISIAANSYATYNRFETVMVLGGDGRLHAVTVPWLEYVPVSRKSVMSSRAVDKQKNEKTDFSGAVRNKIFSYINE